MWFVKTGWGFSGRKLNSAGCQVIGIEGWLHAKRKLLHVGLIGRTKYFKSFLLEN